ncbi:MAG: deoxynucleoside kinase [Promethearchaeota archaeon]
MSLENFPVKKPVVASLEGIHGVGKTTVFNLLKRNRTSAKYKFYSELLSKQPLWPFGSQDKQIAFRSEVYFMQQMMKRNTIVEEHLKNKKFKIAILDRSAISVLAYSKALELPAKDFKVLQDYYYSVNWLESILFYLEAEPETIFKRIKYRGLLEPERLEWNEDDLNYIKRLQKYYNVYLAKLSKKIKVIRIRTDNLTPEQTAEEVIKYLKMYIKIHPLPHGQITIDNWISS